MLGEADARAAGIWWQQERWGEEGLPEFLVRQQVFMPDSLKTVDMIRKGVITYCDPQRIFGDYGHQRLRDYALRAGLVGAGGAAGAVAPPPGSRINEVRAWLAKRAESRNTPAASDSLSGSSSFSLPPLPKVEPRPQASGGPGSSQFLRGSGAVKASAPPSTSLSGV